MKKMQPQKKSVFLILVCLILSSATGVFAAGCDFGAYIGNDDHRTPYDYEIRDFENKIGTHVAGVQIFWSWADGYFSSAELTSNVINHDGYNTQTDIQLTWEPWSRNGGDDNSYQLPNIVAGAYDTFIRQFARDCYNMDTQIDLRFAHEMIVPDGVEAWYPWQNNPTLYVDAWKHVYDIFEEEKLGFSNDNVDFVWAPLGAVGNLATFAEYYPGQDYVEIIGMGGHNAGEDGEIGYPYWQNFEDLFANLYNTVQENPEIFGDKEMMIAECSSADDINSPMRKANWVSNAFWLLKNKYTKINSFYWFNVDKEYDWRVDSTPESLHAFQYWLADEYFTSHVVPEPSSVIMFGAGIAGIIFNFKNRA